MLVKRNATDRGHASHGWLDTWHSFSFANYYDPKHMGFRSLRVINDDRIAAGMGFGTHPHEDMEIITYVLEGSLQHRDSLGTGSVIVPGEAQKMSAGTGIAHSEFNASPREPLHLLQIWIEPEKVGLKPEYEQKKFPLAEQDKLHLIASRDGRGNSVTIHADVDLHAGRLRKGARIDHVLKSGRHAWIQIASGSVAVNDVALRTGDGLAVSDEAQLKIAVNDDSELLLFDLA
jgi:quercetin 2,3-dioxygenase